MKDFFPPIIIGLICILIGIINMKGNISTLHSYHKKRVSEENRIPFGRTIGLGTIICGGALTACGALSAIGYYTESRAPFIIGAVILGVGLVAGLGISIYALIKYNKGIF